MRSRCDSIPSPAISPTPTASAAIPNNVYRPRIRCFRRSWAAASCSSATVNVAGIAQSQAAPETRYDPGNPLADAQGNVYAPNVNVVEEMADMISASRSYQNNVEVLNTSRDMMLDTLKLGQS